MKNTLKLHTSEEMTADNDEIEAQEVEEEETAEEEAETEGEASGYDAGRDKTPEKKMEQADAYVEALGKIKDSDINDLFEQLAKIDEVRANCNKKAAEIRKKAKDLGIASVDMNAGYARFKMNPWDRKKRDAAIQRVNKAMKEQTFFKFD